ncbi:MAG TPA: hypothetical protein IAA29_00255 [Candidatus Paenibacillus intestinavium]|nr:hypothetical protein [Candidatus Paenibacillus intestinavium]
MTYTVDPNSSQIQTVGKLDTAAIKRLIGIDLPVSEVYMYPGVIKHIKKKHKEIFEAYHHLIPEIISNPDYIGKNPTEPNSVELIKQVTATLLLAIKLDPSGYLYLSSLYDLNNAPVKIAKRLNSGRLVKYTPQNL